ncbi:MAG TPA: hypothetical protein VFK51_08895 [Burkholderiales bacterium]|jgi:hypothetical protein|nr:hypothetical protein [Burkholderiales bacterium]
MNDERQSTAPHLRLRELLEIPDRQRSDAEWDELNELEITLASGNRAGAPQQPARRNTPAPANHFRPAGTSYGKRPKKKLRKWPGRSNGWDVKR